MQMLARALERLRETSRLSLVTVVGAAGSTPRHEGAKMIVGADARTEGTIGGGRVELEVTREAAEVAAGGGPRLVRHHLVRDLAMCCGGSMELYIEPLAPARDAIAAALELWRQRRCGALITSVEGGEKRVEAGQTRPGRARREGGTFVEPIRPQERLFVVGCGHVGRAIGTLAAPVGFEVIACDDDETGALSAPRPWAAQTVASFEIPDIEAAAGELGEGDFVAIATRDHALDQRVLERLLARESLTYLGLIGSRRKIERFRRRLEAKNPEAREALSRLRAPIGLPIGAETPEEIAVSVVAELVQVKREWAA